MIEGDKPCLLSGPSGLRGGPLNDPVSQRGQSEDIVSATSCSKPPTLSKLNGLRKFTGAPVSVLQRIIDLYTRLYHSIPDPSKTSLDAQYFAGAIIARAESVMVRWHLKPTNYQREHFRQYATQRLHSSKFTCWVSLVGMSVIESFLEGDVSQNHFHNTWIEYIEGSLKRELALDLAPVEIRNRRSDWVQVALMKSMLIHSTNIYQLLRDITPTFLQLTYSNPTLWSSDHDLTRIPLLNILTSGRNELAHFTLIDCTYAMAYGVPQHVEYDTTLYSQPDGSSSHQWAHSSPTEFLVVLADINACRENSPAARNWQDIEQWLLGWESRPAAHAFVESWMTITWYAVQESWRLALLVYLYLAVCDASSDDTRIQSYIKQILQLVGTVKKLGQHDLNASLFSQYLMIGICTRSETHRQIARDKLASGNETKLWLMRSSDFVPVLDHLWHGAAAGGRPVKWADYIHSREAVLPIVL